MRSVVAAASFVAAVASLQLQSSDFSPSGVIPVHAMAVDCGGENRSPALSWTGAPKATASYALIVHDPDAPLAGGFYHWVVYNLASSARSIAAGAKLAVDQLGETSAGRPGYYGPCPPPGPAHHYVFTLYALDIPRISADAPLTGPELQHRIAGHIVAHTTLTGLASHH